MKKVLWKPDSPDKTKMADLTSIINRNHDQKVNSYEQLHNWSVNHIPEFWEEVWNYCGIVHSEPYTEVVDDIKTMPGAKWFRDTSNFSIVTCIFEFINHSESTKKP